MSNFENALLSNNIFKSDVSKTGAAVFNPGFYPRSGKHRVYNFEVEEHHTYIADGYRVHNTSILSLLSPTELANIDPDTLRDENGDGRFDYVEVDQEINGLAAGTTYYKLETEGGVEVARGYTTYTDEYGNLVQLQFYKDANGIIQSHRIELTGAEFGERAGALVTPFLTQALLSEDATAFDRWAADTIIGTWVENVFEFTGGLIHDQIVSGGRQNNSLEAIAEHTFEDFGDDLIANAVENAEELLVQWVMAEVFESLNTETFAGKFTYLLAQQGVEYILDLTVHEIAVDVLGLNAQQLDAWGLTAPQFDQLFSGANLSNLLFTAAIGTILPDLESTEAQ